MSTKRSFGDPIIKLDTSESDTKLNQQLLELNKQQFNKSKRQAVVEFDDLSLNTWSRDLIYLNLLKQNPNLNSDARKLLKDWVLNHEFTADEISDIANGTFDRKVLQTVTEKLVKRKTTKEEQETYRKLHELNLDNSLKQLLYELFLLKVEEAKNYVKTSEHASSFEEAMLLRAKELGLKETDIKKLASDSRFADILKNWEGSLSKAPFRSEVNKANNKALQLAGAGIVSAPFIGYAAAQAAPVLWGAGKYMLMHPIESFIAPELVRTGMDYGFDAFENATGIKVNDHIRNGSEIAASMIIPSMGFNTLRSKFGAKGMDWVTSTVRRAFGDKAATNVGRNTFVRSQFTFDPGYTAAGAINGNLSTLDKAELFGRLVLPYVPSAVIGFGESYLPGGSISGMLLEQYNVPELVAHGIDFGINTILNHHLTKAVLNPANKTASALDQLSEGNLNTDMGMANMINNFNEGTIRAIRTGEPATTTPKNPNLKPLSYQGAYLKSDSLVEHNIRLLPYTNDPDVPINLRTEMATLKSHKIGDTLINGHAKVSDIVLTGTGQKAGSKPDNIVSRMGLETNNSPGKGRYADGQKLYIIETANSLKIPTMSEMVQDGNWRVLNIGEGGNGEAIPITDINMTLPMQRVHGDLITGGKEMGKNVVLNTGNHQLAILEHNGDFYAVQVDLSGTGSATTGNAAAMKRFADSGESPFILSKVTKLDPNIPIEKQLKLYSKANKVEDTVSMEKLFKDINFSITDIFRPKRAFTRTLELLKQNIGEIVAENNVKRKKVVDRRLHTPRTIDPNTGQVKAPYIEEITVLKANKEKENKIWNLERKSLNNAILRIVLNYKNY